MKNLTAFQTAKIEEFLSSLQTEVDVLNLVGNFNNIDFEDAYNSIYELVESNNGFDIEIIYYSEAMNYLRENDPSLKESLSIAAEYGYTPENLNSEILASLLASRDVRDTFCELESEINEFFEELNEEVEETEE